MFYLNDHFHIHRLLRADSYIEFYKNYQNSMDISTLINACYVQVVQSVKITIFVNVFLTQKVFHAESY